MLGWQPLLDGIRDGRARPHIPCRRVVRALIVMFLARQGSLNALEQSRPCRFWRHLLGAQLPSADTCARVAETIDVGHVRDLAHHIYTRLKRGKALEPPWHGRIAAILDGHESSASYRRCCPGCLKRTIHSDAGDRIQYYHRHVTLTLVSEQLIVPLDIEPQRAGENEVAAARRLWRRCLARYPRAFDLVLADALYADAHFLNEVVGTGKGAIVVLKDQRRDLIQDVHSLCEQSPPQTFNWRGRQCTCWDLSDLSSYPQIKHPVRVVRSVENGSVRRQLDKRVEHLQSHWLWLVVSPPGWQIPTKAVVDLGHSRWLIENATFNELANRWHADHLYHHHPQAILVLTLLAMICLTVFQAFYQRHLKPPWRHRHSRLDIARQILAALMNTAPRTLEPALLPLPP